MDVSNRRDADQIRSIMDQSADAALVRFAAKHPEVRRGTVVSEIPAPLKWAGAIIAGLFTAGTATLAFWLVSTVSDMQVTLARMDERMATYGGQAIDIEALDKRVRNLEDYHRAERP